MRASVIIPVWNGADVIANCLEALRQQGGRNLLEVICVDNGSQDKSAEIIASQHPWARLLCQPVNLGFSGGINAGIQAAQGDLYALLNQDCMVLPGWLDELVIALEAHPLVGVMGSIIFDADGAMNHSGAAIERPDASGAHLTDVPIEEVRPADFVTGAAMAIRREVWDAIGPLDEAFYPAYYEDADYCYRARHAGYQVACAAKAQVRHLFSGRDWQADPYRHAVYTNSSRYRFVCKHYQPAEFSVFFQSEAAAVENDQYLNAAVGRLIAARRALRFFANTLESRQRDLGEQLSPASRRSLQVGFSQVMRSAFQTAKRLLEIPSTTSFTPGNPDTNILTESTLEQIQKSAWELENLRQNEANLVNSLYFRSSSDDSHENSIKHLHRLFFKRLPSLLIGRDERILKELYQIRSTQITHLEGQIALAGRQAEQNKAWLHLLELLSLYDDYFQ